MRPSHPRVRPVELFSLTVAGIGAAFWILAFLVLQGEASRLVQASGLWTSLSFIFFATQLTIVGVAFYAYSLARRRGRDEEEEVESTLDRLEVMLSRQKQSSQDSEVPLRLDLDVLGKIRSGGRFSKIHVVAVVEAMVVLLLYAWLIDEFESNSYMQTWVFGNVPWASYVLNFTSFALFLGLVVGVVASEALLMRRRRNAPQEPGVI